MIRPFDLRDTKLVTYLQQVGTPLDIEEQLTHPRSPLWAVLMNSVLAPRAGPSTFILDQQDENGRLLGLAQVRLRPGRPERDVVFMAPALGVGNGGTHAIWQRLLTYLCVQAAEKGCLSLYASLPVDSDEFQLFKTIGFTEYCQEDVYRLAPDPQRLPAQPGLTLRRQEAGDGWGLQKLYATLTPRLVQNAEGLAQGMWALDRHNWAEPGRHEGYVWETGGELLGALHIHRGKRGFWVRTLLHPDAIDQARPLAEAALRLTIAKNPEIPVYFAVRQYAAGWSATLTDLGFEPFTSQTLVVKPMTVRLFDRSPMLLPVLEKSPSETAPAISRAKLVKRRTVSSKGQS